MGLPLTFLNFCAILPFFRVFHPRPELRTETMQQRILIIISGNPRETETVKFCKLIACRAAFIGANFMVEHAGAELDELLSNPKFQFTCVFVLGQTPLAQDTVNLLLDDEWRRNPRRVIAVLETGRGAAALYTQQQRLLGPNFDYWRHKMEGIEYDFFLLLPEPPQTTF